MDWKLYGGSPCFKSIGRDDPAFAKKLVGEGALLSVGPVFLPNRAIIEKNKKELAFMVPPDTLTSPRARVYKSYNCQLIDETCNF